MAMRDMTSSEAGDVAGAAEADPRERIAKLEAKIEALAQSAERCRKISLAARAAIVLGAVGFAAMALGAWRFGGAPLIFSTAAILGGIVLYGANGSTARQISESTRTAEALRAELIGQMRLRLVAGTDFAP
ncbi:MAG: hypothetical protein IT538_10850 [Variibacter sp.]|nr:hypothetical protein [Variibacter sp.]